MANIKFKTDGIQNPHGKPRVYFTCHPMDFNKKFQNASQACFDKICSDIFKIIDCAIYYTPDMSDTLDTENMEELGCMNLFVVPVTTRLLTTPNRAMNVDIAFAKERNISILPIIMEPVSDSLYSDEKTFGKRQFIDPFHVDSSEVSYEQKLTRFINEKLVDKKMSERIQNAFDSYLFLSYRKMDRSLANELMKKIHNIDGYYDIAIWYDEFLVPGEQWNENIKSAMNMVQNKSNLFILMVTPNITKKVLCDGEVRDNYVVKNEYPDAQTLGMRILPIEIQNTNHKELKNAFFDIPPCVNIRNDDFATVMQEILEEIGDKKNEGDPQHLYYIGLAYLNGIDIEMDSERGIKLLTMAAEGDNCDAIKKLVYVYRYGDGTKKNLGESLRWAKRLAELCKSKYEEDDNETIDAHELLADIHHERGDTIEALQIYENLFELAFNKFGPTDDHTTLIYRKLATVCLDLEDCQMAIGMFRAAYAFQLMNNSKDTSESIATYYEYAKAHLKTEHFLEAYKYLNEAYEKYVDAYTEDDYRTLAVKESLALAYNYNGLHAEAIKMQEDVCDRLRTKYGDDNSAAIKATVNLVRLYSVQGAHDDAIRYATDIHNATCDWFGDENVMSLECLSLLADVYRRAGFFDVAVKHYEGLYNLQREHLGPSHMSTLQERKNLGITYVMMGGDENLHRALEIFNEVLETQKEICPEYELKTVNTKYLIANCYSLLGNNSEAIKLQSEVVNIMRQRYKPNHIHNMTYSHYLGCYYYLRYCEMKQESNAYSKEDMLRILTSAEQCMKEAYAVSSRVYAQDDVKNLRIRSDIEIVQQEKKFLLR